MGESREYKLTGSLLLALAVPIAAFEAITIFSTLSGHLAKGALVGLCVFSAIAAAVVYGLLPEEGRHRALSRATVLASALAVLSALALAGQVGQGRGMLPPAAIVARTVLLALFQTGLALSYWLAADRGRRDQSRYIPAAVGVVLLIVGGFMVGGEAPSARPSVSEAVVEKFDTFPDPEDYAFARETERGGSGKGADFAHYHTGQQPLLGISVSTRDWMRRQRIDGELRGIFDPAANVGGEHALVAEPGFAVASVEVQADEYVNAIRVEFGPLDGSRVSLIDRYWSDWVGGYTAGEETLRLGADADLVVGIAGSKNLVLSSLGLLVAR